MTVLAIAALSCTCLGRSPETYFYRMSAVANGSVSVRLDGQAVGLGPFSFPRYLERPQIVTRTGSSGIAFDGNQRWAGGFEANVIRVLADDLELRLGAPVVVDRASTPLPIAYQVAVEISEFEGRLGGDLVLRARFVIRREGNDDRLWSDEARIQLPVAGSDAASLVRAHDAALGELADIVARGLSRAESQPEPSP